MKNQYSPASTTPPVQFVESIEELISARGHYKAAAFSGVAPPDVKIIRQTGFHLYVRLGLKLELEAADGEPSIRKFLAVIDRYARLAASLADGSEAVLLELQGETLHLFLPARLNAENLEMVFSYVVAFRKSLEEQVREMAGDAWKSVRFSLDHGPTLLLDSTRNVDDSILSLAPAANRPAKEFKRKSTCFPTDTIRLLAGLVLRFPEFKELATNQNTDNPDQWISISLASVEQSLSKSAQGHAKVAKIEERVRSRMMEKQGATINFSSIEIRESIKIGSAGKVDSPTRVFGWVLRADLDGFSSKVDEAFNAVDQVAALSMLTRDFLEMMEDASHFEIGSQLDIIPLPWAGDCASRIIQSSSEACMRDASSVPATVALRWHNKARKGDWLLSIAGGDEDEGKKLVLVADIEVDGRTHRITGGWSVRRSKQGEQEIGGKATETVLHRRDAMGLSEEWRKAFCDIDNVHNFKRATKAALTRASEQTIVAPNIGRKRCSPAILSPRPYAS